MVPAYGNDANCKSLKALANPCGLDRNGPLLLLLPDDFFILNDVIKAAVAKQQGEVEEV